MRARLIKRLLPLYVTKFLRNFVFWYAVEKLFMTSIGYNDASIGLMAAVYSLMSILMEVPSGIIADRWSRKGVIILASICMIISSLIGWVSQDVVVFLVSAVFWGFFDAFSSGTDSAMLYDALLEEQGHTDNFEKISGQFEALGGLALIVSAVIGGLIGEHLSLRDTFLLTIIPASCAIITMLFYKETNFHKESVDTHLFDHIKGTFAAVFRNPNLTWLVVSLLAVVTINNINGEMYQLWYLATQTPTALYGIAGAIILGTYGTGGLIAAYFTKKRRIVGAMAILFVAGIALSLSHVFWITVLAQFVLGFLSFTLWIVLTAQIQRHLPSKYRAGAGSAINTVARMILIPVILLFGLISEQINVFTAAWIIIALAVVGILSEMNVSLRRKPKPTAPA